MKHGCWCFGMFRFRFDYAQDLQECEFEKAKLQSNFEFETEITK